MANDTIDLFKNYLLLESDGEAVTLPGGGDFWGQLMSGNPADTGIRRLVDSKHGRLFSALHMGQRATPTSDMRISKPQKRTTMPRFIKFLPYFAQRPNSLMESPFNLR